MPDDRTLRDKLQDMVRLGTEHEAERAREAIARLDGAKEAAQSGRVLSRSAVLAQPPDPAPRLVVRVKYPNGTWVKLTTGEIDWEMVEAHHLWWHFADEPERKRHGFKPTDALEVMERWVRREGRL